MLNSTLEQAFAVAYEAHAAAHAVMMDAINSSSGTDEGSPAYVTYVASVEAEHIAWRAREDAYIALHVWE